MLCRIRSGWAVLEIDTGKILGVFDTRELAMEYMQRYINNKS